MSLALRYILAEGDQPYENLAMEEYLLHHVIPGQVILYLWQNRHTVVIGRNQNCWKECRVTELEGEGGFLARRLSGGGAVYHDLGNLNFTFVAHRGVYDVSRQTDVILDAVRALDVPAEKSGRNDLTVAGRKFSGHAYYETASACCHHGTLLLHTDGARMARFLTVSREKLESKGVDSVPARVCNLDEYVPQLTAEPMKTALMDAFSHRYGGYVQPLNAGELDRTQLEELTEKYASHQWRYGKSLPFQYQLEGHFPWGEVQLQLQVEGGALAGCRLWSDGLDADYLGGIASRLTGHPFHGPALRAALDECAPDTEERAAILADIRGLLLDAM